MQAVVAHSIADFRREEWNRLFPGELEDWNYYRAVEQCGLPEFSWFYVGVRHDGRLLAALPGFITDYRLDTTISGTLLHVTSAIARVFPRLLTLRMLALGSPVTEKCHLGFEPGMDDAEQRRLLAAIFEAVQRHATDNSARMIAVKDTPETQDEIWAPTAKSFGLRRQPGLPTACLDMHFDDADAYLRSLSRATRKDLRRKLRSRSALRVEWRENIDDVLDQVLSLYQSTREGAEYQFEELTPTYFSNVLHELGEHARCALYWLDERLVAFNLLLLDGDCLLDKFFGMDKALAREYNLYFVSWMENVHYCIRHGIAMYQSGQGLHDVKTRLGSRLSPNWLWYRHRSRAVDTVLALLERLARLDRHDPQLAALIEKHSQ